MSRLLRRIFDRAIAKTIKPGQVSRPSRTMADLKTRLLLQPLEERTVPTTFTVNALTDTGPSTTGTGSGTSGDLRYCIAQANANLGTNTIDATGVSGTITLASALPTIVLNDNLTFAGPGAGNLTINANRLGRIFTDAATSFSVSGVTLTGGLLTGTASPGSAGGAIEMTATSASLTVSNAVLANNNAGTSGGAIYMANTGTLTVTNSLITGNTAGSGGSTIFDAGGGIYFNSGGSLNLQNSTISFNSVAPGSQNGGGGVFFSGAITAYTINNSTIANNTATNGGGLAFTNPSNTATIKNSTITGNVATSASATAGYGGGGIAKRTGSGGVITLDNTIVSGNSAGNANADVAFTTSGGTLNANFSALGTSAGYTLSGTSGNNLTGATASVAALKLGPLTVKTLGPGQSLPVFPLLLGSTAIDVGDPAQGGSGFTDERGVARPQGAGVDVGAFERTPGPDAVAAAPYVTAAGAAAYTFTVTYTDNVPIDPATLGSGNVTVAVPAGIPAVTVSYVGADASNPNSVVATYSFTPPGGSWVSAANGVYSINVGASPAADANGAVAGGTLTTFQALAPRTITVTSTADDNIAGTLRNAINQANGDVTAAGSYPADLIMFSNTTAGGAVNFFDGTQHTISVGVAVAAPLPVIAGPITITGPGAGFLTINRGAGSGRLLGASAPAGQTVTISGLTVGGGVNSGGGILVGSGNLSLSGVAVSNNVSGTVGGGIAVTAPGTLTLTNSTVTGNNAAGAAGGGIALNVAGVTLNMVNSTVSGNSGGNGGGIFAGGADTLTVTNSTVANNSAVGNGGGIDLSVTGSSLTVTGSTLSGNTANGANGGGGIYFGGTPGAGGLSVTNSTIAGNRAVNGGGIDLVNMTGTATVTSSTITANTAINTVTLNGLGGGGIALKNVGAAGATVALDNSIVSGNAAVNGDAEVSAVTNAVASAVVSAKYSAIGSTAGFTLTDQGNNLAGFALLLGPLGNNGGPTATVPLLAPSAALGVGDPTLVGTTDQRGVLRPQQMGPAARPDIGAYERTANTLSASAAVTNVTSAAAPATYTFTVTYANDVAIYTGSIGPNNVAVVPPAGVTAPTVSVAGVDSTNPTREIVTYQFTAPGGAWVPADDGFYTIVVGASPVVDANGTPVPAGPLAAFQAAVPATFTVANTNDDTNAGSLRTAITQANAATTPAVIVFSNSTAGGATNFYDGTAHTISLLSALPTVANDVTLTGPGSALLTVNRSAGSIRIFDVGNANRVLAVSMSGLTVTGGTSGTGTGIQDADEMLSLSDVTVRNNSGTSTGAGIWLSGPGYLSLANSTVQGNSTSGIGGGVATSSAATFVLNNSSVTGQTASAGGGLSMGAAGIVSLSNSTVANNRVGSVGGGLSFTSGAVTVTVTGSSVTGNSAGGNGGGVNLTASGAFLTVTNSTVAGNTGSLGGGVTLFNSNNVLIDKSTLSGNTSTSNGNSGGGGLYFNGTPAPGGFTIRNSTIANNSAASSGGGITAASFGGTLTIVGSTITGNTAGSGNVTGTTAPYGGGGIDIRSNAAAGPGTISLDNTIVSGNSLSAATNNGNTDLANKNTTGTTTFGSFATAYSAIGNSAGSSYAPAATDLPVGANLGLGTLTNNGGPTQTVALGSGSAAVNAGDPALAGTTDQRGVTRPQGPGVDIGAFERVPGVPSGAVTAAPNVTEANVAASNPYQFTVTYTDDTAIKVSTIDSNDVTVTGPAGAPAATVSLVPGSVSPNTNAATVSATYQFTVPGGWTGAADGTWTISMAGSQVFSTNNVAVPAGLIGAFQVTLPQQLLVTNTNDSGPGSLRDAVTKANAVTGTATADAITFSATAAGGAVNFYDGTAHTITLLGALPTIADTVTITGPGSGLLTVRRTATAGAFRVLDVNTPTVALSGLTVSGGSAVPVVSGINVIDNGYGGGIRWDAPLGGVGGSSGSLTLTDVAVTGNSSSGQGGGIVLEQGAGTLTLTHSVVSGNTAQSGGGGIADLGANSVLTVTNSSVAGNTAVVGGGIAVPILTAGVNLTNSTVSGNTATDSAKGGGGLYLAGFGGSVGFVVTDSTVANNRAANGGGFLLSNFTGLLQLTSSTVTGNSATSGDAGYGYGGGGIALRSGSQVETIALDNTIVSGNNASNGLSDISTAAGATVTAAYSALGSSTGYVLTDNGNNLTGASATPTALVLRPLANNGGPTQTVALGAGSTAVNAGDPAQAGTDQRGVIRPAGQVSIGSYQYVATPAPAVSGVQINDGNPQRSEVRSITVTFPEAVNFAGGNGNAAAAFTLSRAGGGNVGLVATVAPDNRSVTLTWTGTAEIDPVSTQNGGVRSLADGVYHLAIADGVVTSAANGQALDGDNNGTAGGAYSSPTDTAAGGPGQLRLLRLFGDATGDGMVDLLDLSQLRAAFNSTGPGSPYVSYLDADNSNQVDLIDLGQFRLRFNVNLLP